jgi:trypsin
MRIKAGVIAGLLLALILTPFMPAQAVQQRIIGGSPVEITDFPWQVLLIVNGDRQCAGAVVTDQWILTVAHCVSGLSPGAIRAYSGISNIRNRNQPLPIANVIVHPDWSPSTFLNDIALIQLAVPLTLGPSQQPIALPDGLDPQVWPAFGTAARVAGWGATTNGGSASDVLQQASVDILAGPESDVCGAYAGQFDRLSQICAGKPEGGVDACQGDSGGGLVIDVAGRPTLAGLVSTGIECALPAYPGQYTRITTYLSWIRQFVALPATMSDPPTLTSVQVRAKGTALVRWEAPLSDGGSPVTEYRVTSTPQSAGCQSVGNECLVRNLVPGRRYTFVVEAINGVGASAPSIPQNIVAVDRIARVGRSILIAPAGERVRVRPASRVICRADQRRVRLLQPGICRVMVKSKLTVIQVLARPLAES